jgi:hypothetical protein
MAEVVHDAQQEFWQSPVRLAPPTEPDLANPVQNMAEACGQCRTEYMIGAKFCHACGVRRLSLAELAADSGHAAALWSEVSIWLRQTLNSAAGYVRKVSLPSWLGYLHFHEIKRRVGLPTGSLIAFIIGLGCVAGAVGVSLFYRASNLGEFQAIQMWRMEWLLAATASFVAGILLKNPSGRDSE